MRLEKEILRAIERDVLDVRVDKDPLEAGMLDSLALEQLIVLLEERYGITFLDHELVAERFASVPAVAGLVREKLESR